MVNFKMRVITVISKFCRLRGRSAAPTATTSSSIDSQQTQLDSLQQQIKELRPLGSSQQSASGGRKSRWDRTSAVTSSAAPPQPGVAPPGLPMVDLSRPP